MFKPNLLFPGIPIHLIRSVRPILAAQALSCAVFVLLVLLAGPSYAADTDGPATLPASLLPGLPAWFPQLLGAQATFIYQNMPAFHSPYIGQDSLRSTTAWAGDEPRPTASISAPRSPVIFRPTSTSRCSRATG